MFIVALFLRFGSNLCVNQRIVDKEDVPYTYRYTDTDTYSDKQTHAHIHTHMHIIVLSLSKVQQFATQRTVEHQGTLFFTVSHSLLKFMSIKVVILSNHFILCHPLFLWPSIFPSIRVFSNSNELALCIRWPKCWRFSISPPNE